jgi:hypothetical protein
MQNHPPHLSIEKRGIHGIYPHARTPRNIDTSRIDAGQRAKEIEGPQKLVHLNGFQRRAGDHGLPLHVVNRIVVAEAPQIALQRAAAAVQSLHDEDCAIAPLIPFQRLFIAPDGDAAAIVGYEKRG